MFPQPLLRSLTASLRPVRMRRLSHSLRLSDLPTWRSRLGRSQFSSRRRGLCTSKSEDEQLEGILENNRRWVASKLAEDPNYFGEWSVESVPSRLTSQ